LPSGIVTVFAGQAEQSGNNGNNRVKGPDALFNAPRGICCDNSGNIYVADSGNNQIRKITQDKWVTLVAGSTKGAAGFKSGIGKDALFNEPTDIAINATGTVFVADRSNHAVRLIKPGISQVLTVAGNGKPGDSYGIGIQSRLRFPYSIACTPSGDVLISDAGNYKIKLLNLNFMLLKYSGTGTKGSATGIATVCEYNDLKYSDIDPSGNLYVIDYIEGNARLLRVDTNGTCSVIKDFAGTTEGYYTVGVATNNSGHLYVTESEFVATEYTSSSSSSTSSSSSSSMSSSSSTSSESVGNTSSSSSSSSSSSFNDHNKITEDGNNRVIEDGTNLVHEGPFFFSSSSSSSSIDSSSSSSSSSIDSSSSSSSSSSSWGYSSSSSSSTSSSSSSTSSVSSSSSSSMSSSSSSSSIDSSSTSSESVGNVSSSSSSSTSSSSSSTSSESVGNFSSSSSSDIAQKLELEDGNNLELEDGNYLDLE